LIFLYLYLNELSIENQSLMKILYFAATLAFILFFTTAHADDGYRLWLRYDKIADAGLLEKYKKQIQSIRVIGDSPVLKSARKELESGIVGFLGINISENSAENGIVAGLAESMGALVPPEKKSALRSEGYAVFNKNNKIVVAGFDEKGVLYGCFHLLRLMGQHADLSRLDILENPKVQIRVLNHWDNLDRTVERGYAGFSIWNWHQLPDYIDPRYTDYARANASIGINGAVVTNVNANALVFRRDYLEKTAALAGVFRSYGLKIYLTARFSAPIELGGLPTADPLNPEVQRWWQEKAGEIYELIPDFGGFLVKANSEGQPGPQDYGRSHADGANMLARALAPYGGFVMWRAFVYSHESPADRFKQAYMEFKPLDGKFDDNVLIQVKNGPIDFQPREPVSPLFGAMPQTPVMIEFQITKEYLGQGTHLVGLASLYEEALRTDTYSKGAGSTVAKVVDGMAGVANIGADRNWTGHLFGQADWYAFGRLAWDPYMAASDIFQEWTLLTFPVSAQAQQTIVDLLKNSYETCVNYMTPLGLHHIMAEGHHYGPGPWVDKLPRADWNSVYYHKADSLGLGFDRTASGSNALGQYAPDFRKQYENPDQCPSEFLLWFHHVRWSQQLANGKNLWENLCRSYHAGAAQVKAMKKQWQRLEPEIDSEHFQSVLMHLNIQEKEAAWWRDACLTYFQQFSKMAIPADLEQPLRDLEYYEKLNYPYAPGIRPKW
jgi:alpha-glucuronidase